MRLLGRRSAVREPHPAGATTPSEALVLAEKLAAEGRCQDAIDVLTRCNRQKRTPAVERLLVRLRHDALVEIERTPSVDPWPPGLPDPAPGADGVVEIRADELTADRMGGAIQHHGCVLVRGLIPRPAVDRLVENVDRAFDAAEAWRVGGDDALRDDGGSWFEPFAPDPRYTLETLDFARRRRNYYRVLLADSPSSMFDVLEAFEGAGMRAALAGYLGSRPVLSKFSMRRMPWRRENLGWHQERGVFRRPTRAVNFWIALSACGTDAPGLEVIPHRMTDVVESPGKGYALKDGIVETLGLPPPVAPAFEPGDAIAFDDLLLHRTAARDDMQVVRYSIESWFFAPQDFPRTLLPIVF
jgi:hypothetical protein